MRSRLLFIVSVLGMAFLGKVTDLGAQDAGAPVYVGAETCAACHEQADGHWAHTVHAKIFKLNPRDDLEAQQCEACHGPGSAHAEDPGNKASIIRFTHDSPQPAAEQNGMCLACHKGGQRIHWTSSAHERSDITCADCHNPMARFSSKGLLAGRGISETCFSCHRQQRTEFNKRSHMPLPEGLMTCVDCHSPHGSVTDPLLKADTVNEGCFECHAEKRGPFIWEHAPVRESCLNCHTPHGSNHDKLLITARPILCQQCHTMIGHMNDLITRGQLAGGRLPDERAIGRSCSNWHVQIHGSNHPAGVKFHR